MSEGVGEARPEAEGELALARIALDDGDLRHAAAHASNAIASDPTLTSPRPRSRASIWAGQDRPARAAPAAYRPGRAASPATPPAAGTRFHGIAALP